MQFTCCGYTYGTRFGHNLTGPPGKLNPVPEWRLKNKIMPNLQSLRIYLKSERSTTNLRDKKRIETSNQESEHCLQTIFNK
jgi:hypothetical protein